MPSPSCCLPAVHLATSTRRGRGEARRPDLAVRVFAIVLWLSALQAAAAAAVALYMYQYLYTLLLCVTAPTVQATWGWYQATAANLLASVLCSPCPARTAWRPACGGMARLQKEEVHSLFVCFLYCTGILLRPHSGVEVCDAFELNLNLEPQLGAWERGRELI
uniref:Uncharacterized protein n=1 Tax=Setaria italica TaxID=4555 RepID=K3ZAB9_SETIT